MTAGYHIEHIPITPDRGRHPKGNGGKIGCIEGHRITPLENSGSLLYGNGCLRHGYTDCFNCPREAQGLDCDYDFEIEYWLRRKIKGGNQIQ